MNGISLSKILRAGPMMTGSGLLDGHILFVRWDSDSDVGRQVWEVKTNLATGAFLGVR